MKAFSRDEILKISDIKIQPVKAWGGIVYVRGMTGQERDKFEAGVVKMHGDKQEINLTNVRAKLCALTICDEEGKRLFKDDEYTLLAENQQRTAEDFHRCTETVPACQQKILKN